MKKDIEYTNTTNHLDPLYETCNSKRKMHKQLIHVMIDKCPTTRRILFSPDTAGHPEIIYIKD